MRSAHLRAAQRCDDDALAASRARAWTALRALTRPRAGRIVEPRAAPVLLDVLAQLLDRVGVGVEGERRDLIDQEQPALEHRRERRVGRRVALYRVTGRDEARHLRADLDRALRRRGMQIHDE